MFTYEFGPMKHHRANTMIQLQNKNPNQLKTQFMKQFYSLLLLLMIASVIFGQEEPVPGTVQYVATKSASALEEDSGLEPLYSVSGHYYLSSDAIGSLSTSMYVDVNKPTAEATVHKAFLFSATYANRTLADGCVSILGTPVNWDGTMNNPVSNGTLPFFNNYWADVTTIVASYIDGLPAGIASIPIGECLTSYTDGEVLLVIFEDEAETEKTISILWGGSSTDGDNFNISLHDPIDPSDPESVLDMGLGISYGYLTTYFRTQYSIIDINGNRLTTSAGGQDDGYSSNGGLITVGGIGDSNANPADPYATPTNARSDDELYSLLPFIDLSTTTLSGYTSNPSDDDNIFLAYFVISGQASVTVDCPGDIEVNNDPGQCGAVVEYTVPEGSVQTSGLPSGSEFPVGTTLNTFTNPDCSFSVTVVDAENPTALCQDAEVYLEKDGTVAIEPEDVDAGSSDNCLFDLSVDPEVFDCVDLGVAESIEEEVTLTITDASGNTDECTSTVTIMQRPTTLTYTGDPSAQYSDDVNLSATLTDDLSGDGIEGMSITFEIGSQSTTGVTDATGAATATLTLDQSTCDLSVWTVKASYDGVCPFLGSEDEDPFNYLPENASMEYTGVAISATESVNSDDFHVTLRGIVKDANDGDPGNISLAQARFLVNDAPVSGWIQVKLLDAGDPSIGMIEFLWEDAISINPTTYDVKIEMKDCYYTGTSIAYPLTVYNAAGDFITGGGFMIMTEATDGLYKASPDSKLNFGFNIKFNKNGKNLQGKMNIIYRVLDGYGNIVEKYQIKSNATTSLGTNRLEDGELVAEFVSKANLTLLDEFDVGVEIAGNLTLHVRLTDRGEPGDMDQIAFSLFNGDPSDPNALWFSSNWDVTQTVEQIIEGGNLVVHSGVALSSDGVEEVSNNNKTKSVAISTWENSMSVYPNPFVEDLYFEFSREESCHAKLAIFDMTGKMIDVLFDQSIEGERYYRIKYSPSETRSGMLFYRMTFDEEVMSGKVIFGN